MAGRGAKRRTIWSEAAAAQGLSGMCGRISNRLGSSKKVTKSKDQFGVFTFVSRLVSRFKKKYPTMNS